MEAAAPDFDAQGIGVLVMAHGGGETWDGAVREAAADLDAELPTEVAFGMANRVTLSQGLERLRARGADRVAVVRLFLSGSSFREQTYYYLGVSDAAPTRFLLMGPGSSDVDAREPIEHGLEISTHEDGLLTSAHAQSILADRARALSHDPSAESVLFIAHGMGDDAENQRVLDAMAVASASLRGERFARVGATALREDWPEARAIAEEEIRSFVDEENRVGRDVLVVPARLFGFGPYASVLGEREYREGAGLLPHPAITTWIRDTAAAVTCAAGWGPTLRPCAVAAPDPS